MYHQPNRRFLLLALLLIAFFAVALISFFNTPAPSSPYRSFPSQYDNSEQSTQIDNPAPPPPPATDVSPHLALPDETILTGTHIAPALENATAKAELGRAAWKLFHTVFARFPDSPTADESAALRSYVYLFARLYPCGECAEHFAAILAKYPPQVSSRSTAAAWGCHVHNKVNESLEKELFDCSKIGDFYKCGCADEDEGPQQSKKEVVVADDETEPVELAKEEYQRGGR